MADKTGVAKASISQYVNGRNVPSNITARKICEPFGINPAWLMGFDVPMREMDSDPYYTDPDTARAAQEAFEKNRALFDAARDSKPEDIQMAVDLLERLKETNPDG